MTPLISILKTTRSSNMLISRKNKSNNKIAEFGNSNKKPASKLKKFSKSKKMVKSKKLLKSKIYLKIIW